MTLSVWKVFSDIADLLTFGEFVAQLPPCAEHAHLPA